MKRHERHRPEARSPRRIPAWLAFVLGAVVVVGIAVGTRFLFPDVTSRPELDDLRAYFLRTRAESKLLVASQDAWFESDYVVPASFLGIRSDYKVRFRVLVTIGFALEIDHEDWAVDVSGDVVRIRTPRLELVEPRIRTETFEILREDRSILVNEEAKKLELFRKLGPWVRERVEQAADFDSARDMAAEAVMTIARRSFEMFGKRAGAIDVWIP